MEFAAPLSRDDSPHTNNEIPTIKIVRGRGGGTFLVVSRKCYSPISAISTSTTAVVQHGAINGVVFFQCAVRAYFVLSANAGTIYRTPPPLSPQSILPQFLLLPVVCVLSTFELYL